MPVTTRRQSRGLLNTNTIGERPKDMPARIMQDSEDDDDLMDAVSDHEERDDVESDDDFGGVFHTTSGHRSWLTVHMM